MSDDKVSRQEMAIAALRFACDSDCRVESVTAEDVVKRAGVYLAFLTEEVARVGQYTQARVVAAQRQMQASHNNDASF